MSTCKNNAQTKQKLYLETKEEKYLKELYLQLIKLGRILQQNDPLLPQDPDAVIDIVGGVCLRLLEKQQPVFKSPSSYMAHALYYYGKTGTVFADIEDHVELEGPSYSGPDLDLCIRNILDEAEIDTDTEVGALVEQTLLSRVKWTSVNKQLLYKDRLKYEKQMEKVYNGIKDRVQSSGVLPPSRRIRWHKVLRRAPTPRAERQGAQSSVVDSQTWNLERTVPEPEVADHESAAAQESAVM